MRLAELRPRLDTRNLRGDLFGGVTAAIVALPLALAFGVASGAGPVAGLYGAIFAGFFAALLGGTPAQVTGPTGPMTVVAAAIFTAHAGNPAIAFTIIMLSGLLQLLFGWLRFGRYINLVPYPVISGFLSGIGVIIIVMQLDPLLGHPAQATVGNALSVLPAGLAQPIWHAVLAGALALGACLFLPRRITEVVPATLIALVLGTAAVAVWWPEAPLLGTIPSALPSFQLPVLNLQLLNETLPPALVLAGLGSIDSLLTSLVADNATRTFHDSDRELVGQGIGNFMAGLAGGIPSAGATIRTLVNIRSGGRTSISGMTHAVVLLGIALGLGPLAAHIPHAVLAGILIKVGIDVIDWPYLRRSPRMPISATACMMTVLALTVFVDVITAVAVGTVMASLILVSELAELQDHSIRAIDSHEGGSDILSPQDKQRFLALKGRALLLHLSGPMSFGAATTMTRRVAMAAEAPVLLLDLQDVTILDVSAALALEALLQRASARGQQVLACGLRPAVEEVFDRVGAGQFVPAERRFRGRTEALLAIETLLGQDLPTANGNS